jgi:hypothetical protein
MALFFAFDHDHIFNELPLLGRELIELIKVQWYSAVSTFPPADFWASTSELVCQHYVQLGTAQSYPPLA